MKAKPKAKLAIVRRALTPRAVQAIHVGEPALSIRGLHLRRGGRAVLRDLSLTVRRGEFVALMGPSGTGKTTLLRAVLGLEAFDEGTVIVDGAARGPGAGSRELDALRQRVGMVFQFHHLFSHLSALENVALAPIHARRTPRAEAEARARALLHELGVGDRAHALPRELSGGEAQRVAIARALAMDPPLLLLDEPTASLDHARRGELGQALRRLADGGRAVLCTTHDGDFARGHASRVCVLGDGALAEAPLPSRWGA